MKYLDKLCGQFKSLYIETKGGLLLVGLLIMDDFKCCTDSGSIFGRTIYIYFFIYIILSYQFRLQGFIALTMLETILHA